MSTTMLIVAVTISLLGCVAADCVIDFRSRDNEWEKLLNRDLVDKYYRDEMPCENTSSVNLIHTLKYFFFDDKEEDITIDTWSLVTWNDSRLTWEPSDYDNIDKTLLPIGYLGNPLWVTAKSNKKNDFDDTYGYYSGLCIVNRDGEASCALREIFTTTCKTKLRDWPYDIKNCTFLFQNKPLKYTRMNRNIKFYYVTNMIAKDIGTGWDIIDYNYGKNHNSTEFYLNLVFERQSFGLVAKFVFPLIAMAILNSSCMFLDVATNTRIIMLCFSLMGHFIILEDLNTHLPPHGTDIPSILIFARLSIFVTLCTFVLTIFLNVLRKRSTPLSWVDDFNNFVLHSHLKYFIFPILKLDSMLVETENSVIVKDSWGYFVTIINSLFLFVLILTYIISYCMYTPQSVASK